MLPRSCFIVLFALLATWNVSVAFAQQPQNYTDYNEWILLNITGNISARPYVSDFSIINGNSVVNVISGVTSPFNNDASLRQSGAVVPVVYPINLCTPSSQGTCYNPPNRVGLSVIYMTSGGGSGNNFRNPSVTLSTPVNENTIFDVKLNFNAMSSMLGWTWMNANLLYSEFRANASSNSSWIRIKFRLAFAPVVNFPNPNGCTATPIRDCNITQASAPAKLTADMVFSMDQTLGGAQFLQGAVFATSNAIIGYLLPTSTQLEYQLSSAHFTDDGTTLMLGTLRAFLAQSTLQTLFPSLPTNLTEAIQYLNVTRSGSNGTEAAITITQISLANEGTTGVAIDVKNITFSTPSYIVRARSSAGTIFFSPMLTTLIVLAVTLFLRF